MDRRARSSGRSNAIADGTMSAMMRAPWLPPKTRSRSVPSAAGYGVAAAAATAGRTGLPVSVALAAKAGAFANRSGNVVAIAVTRGAKKRLARPMTALASWIRLGTPRQVAARTGGMVG